MLQRCTLQGWCSMLRSNLEICCHTATYYAAFAYFYWWNGCIDSSGAQWLLGQDWLPAVHMYTLSKQLHLWHSPHYRAPTFAEDLRSNLKNVAIPGTGLPLSIFFLNRLTALLFILVVNPLACLAAACYLVLCNRQSTSTSNSSSRHSTSLHQQPSQQCSSVAGAYGDLLLRPKHWFAIWRHNCLVVGYHALVSGSSSYRLEDKGVFLLEGDRLGLPVSPFYKDEVVFVKHKSIEGGMGINVYKNFAKGGDWIIQKALSNSSALAQLLPHDAPLSTIRVVTASAAWLEAQGVQGQHKQRLSQQLCSIGNTGQTNNNSSNACSSSSSSSSSRLKGMSGAAANGCDADKPRPPTPPLPVSNGVFRQRALQAEGQPWQPQVDGVSSCSRNMSAGQQQRVKCNATALGGQERQQCYAGRVEVVTAVWRAGLSGADTDHTCVCFSIDTDSGELGPGVTANHWYRLGVRGLGAVAGSDLQQQQLVHPQTGRRVAGVVVPEMPDVLRAVVQAHMVAAPDVPLIGWDVALTPDGVYILEVNISCNLFNGQFDRDGYYSMLFQYLAVLAQAEEQHQTNKLQQQRCSRSR